MVQTRMPRASEYMATPKSACRRSCKHDSTRTTIVDTHEHRKVVLPTNIGKRKRVGHEKQSGEDSEKTGDTDDDKKLAERVDAPRAAVDMSTRPTRGA